MHDTTDDPIRAEVERVLNVLVGATIVAPFAVVTFVPRCMLRQARAIRRRITEPARVARSLIDLVGAGGAGGPVVEAQTRPPHANVERPAAASASASASAEPLPIDEYESLAASQVVDRLSNLTDEELSAVREFEAVHRGRRTILGRIDQLLA